MSKSCCSRWKKTKGYQYDYWKCSRGGFEISIVWDRGRGSHDWDVYKRVRGSAVSRDHRRGSAGSLAAAKVAACRHGVENIKAWAKADPKALAKRWRRGRR